MKDVGVILLAGGKGVRFGHPLPKQWQLFKGKPVSQHSLDIFLSLEEVEKIVVVADPAYRNLISVNDFAMPGERRQDSVYNGLQEIESEFVLIHDACRPNITVEMCERVITAARQFGAASVGMPLKFTIKQQKDQRVIHTPNREEYWEIQTPQVIRKELLLEGFQYINKNKITVTDDVSIVEAIGAPVYLVEGDYENIKITTPGDIK